MKNSDVQVPYTDVCFKLNDGTTFSASDTAVYEANKRLFSGVDEGQINMLKRRLAGNTEPDHKSVITISTNGDISYDINLPISS